MRYEVRLQPLAESDLGAAYLWSAKRAPESTRLWLLRFHDALQSLAVHPERCGFAPEHKKLKRELRQLLFGRKPNIFRAVFVIEPQVVRVIRIRRAARRALTKNDLGE